MTNIIESIRAEYVRYKGLAEGAIDQLGDDDLSAPGPNGGNSITVICWHVSGNLKSRFTEFLTSDGEKPWRSRDEEFGARSVTRDSLLAKWAEGWKVLLATLDALSDEQLDQIVTIRSQPHSVHQALHRSLAHTSYHVGQIVYIAKGMRGKDWKYLSIAPGKSEAYTNTLSATGQNT
jgi:uncharacterized damage-inducible protein DinB